MKVVYMDEIKVVYANKRHGKMFGNWENLNELREQCCDVQECGGKKKLVMWMKMKVVNVDENESCLYEWKSCKKSLEIWKSWVN